MEGRGQEERRSVIRDRKNGGHSERFEEIMRGFLGENLAVAFSGGVDSSLILYYACQTAKEEGKKVYAMILHTMLQTKSEICRAKEAAVGMGAVPVVLEVDEWGEAGIEDNPPDRCYRCKRYLFGRMKEEAGKLGVSVILEGTNEDDLHVYRPGLRAVRELGICSPLADAGMTKEEVRREAGRLGLAVADKPSSPCLATRFPYGTKLTEEKLKRVEQAEAYLKNLGAENVRLRIHGDVVRIETDGSFLEKLLKKRREVLEYLKGLGYVYITLDLQGFRSGSMDEKQGLF